MQVAAQRRPDVATAEILCCRTQFDERVRLPARPCLGDDLRGLRSDAGQRLPAVRGAVTLAVGIAERLDDVGRVAVGHHPPRVLPRPILVVRNLTQCDDRIHDSSVPAHGAREFIGREVGGGPVNKGTDLVLGVPPAKNSISSPA